MGERAVKREVRTVYWVGSGVFLHAEHAYQSGASRMMADVGAWDRFANGRGTKHAYRVRDRLARWLQWRDRRLDELAEQAAKERDRQAWLSSKD